MEYLEFIETPTFSRKCKELLTEDEYCQLQEYLTHSPDAGAVIVGTGGCRKIRWAKAGKGKSGGVRAIYYYLCADGQIFMLLVYPKSDKDSLSNNEKAILKSIVQSLS
ncbi:type II toxin-antitoxin system RelE/ParE family toxin [Ewingella allii]|uniref:type II toxin-antitoxin system RelE/ParE family toxin n=1 Tax=Ewingella allii TaxID=3092550 RepID=UPI003790CEE2